MIALASLQHRLEALIDQVSDLERSEFPYEDSRQALARVKRTFTRTLKQVKSSGKTTNPELIKGLANVALELCVKYLPVLGFILRSTNVRNGFELVGPLRRLARQLLLPDQNPAELGVQLLLSSEWEYMPLFRSEADLPGYIMIGLPANESSNPLLFPLCGHELGHALWRMGDREDRYSKLLGEKFTSLLADEADWKQFTTAFPQFQSHPQPPSPGQGNGADLFDEAVSFSAVRTRAVQWATMQAEEVFCDFTGLRLFGESYLLAFTYLLAPGNIGKRLPGYPNPRERVEHIQKAAKFFEILHSGVTPEMFDNRPEWEVPSDKLLMHLADQSVRSILDDLMADVKEAAEYAKISKHDGKGVAAILSKFRWAVPACECDSLSDILNAGWKVYEDEKFWADHPNIDARKNMILKELLLKNIELFEVEQIYRQPE